MRRAMILAAALVGLMVAGTASAGSMMTELKNAAKMGEKDSPKDDQVKFTLFFSGGEAQVEITGRDYESFELHERDGVPTQLELFSGSGEEKQNILINIEAARYYQLYIKKQYGEWHYDFQFYY